MALDFKKVLTLTAVGTLGAGIVNMIAGKYLAGIAATTNILGVTVGSFLVTGIAFVVYDYAVNK